MVRRESAARMLTVTPHSNMRARTGMRKVRLSLSLYEERLLKRQRSATASAPAIRPRLLPQVPAAAPQIGLDRRWLQLPDVGAAAMEAAEASLMRTLSLLRCWPAPRLARAGPAWLTQCDCQARTKHLQALGSARIAEAVVVTVATMSTALMMAMTSSGLRRGCVATDSGRRSAPRTLHRQRPQLLSWLAGLAGTSLASGSATGATHCTAMRVWTFLTSSQVRWGLWCWLLQQRQRTRALRA